MTAYRDLHEEIVDMVEAIHYLKSRDDHFLRLFNEYDDVSSALCRVMDGSDIVDEPTAQMLRRRRGELKDELYLIMRAVTA